MNSQLDALAWKFHRQLCNVEKAFGRDARVCDLTAPILDISPTEGQPVKHLYRYHWHEEKAFGGDARECDLTAPILDICNHRGVAHIVDTNGIAITTSNQYVDSP
ncbi:hypothetical protein P3S68_028171 [Capsicum galapagoense]